MHVDIWEIKAQLATFATCNMTHASGRDDKYLCCPSFRDAAVLVEVRVVQFNAVVLAYALKITRIC